MHNSIFICPKHTQMLPAVLTIMHYNWAEDMWGNNLRQSLHHITVCQNYASDAFPLFPWERVFTSTRYLIERGNRWHSRQKLKFIRKQLLSNHRLTLSSHSVLYLWRQYSNNDTVSLCIYLSFSYRFHFLNHFCPVCSNVLVLRHCGPIP